MHRSISQYQRTSRQIVSPLLFSVVVVVKLVLIEETNKGRQREENRMLFCFGGCDGGVSVSFFASVDRVSEIVRSLQ